MESILDKELMETIAEAMAEGECQTLDEVRVMFSISLRAAVKLMNDTDFLITVSQYTKAKANMFFHTIAMNKLMVIAETGEAKEAMTAIKMVGQYSNNLNIKSNAVNVSISLEDRVLQAERNVTKYLSPVEMKQLPPADITSTDQVFDLDTLDLIPVTEKGEGFKTLWESVEEDDD